MYSGTILINNISPPPYLQKTIVVGAKYISCTTVTFLNFKYIFNTDSRTK